MRLGLLCFLGALLLGALSSYPAFGLVQALELKYPFGRVANRCFMLSSIIFLFVYFYYSKFNWRVLFPKKSELKPNSRRILFGFLFGFATLALLGAFLIWADVRIFRHELEVKKITYRLLSGILSGVIIALIEESIFRRLLLDYLKPKISWFWAATVSSLIYAAVHFIRSFHPIAEPQWYSGFTHFFNAFSRYTEVETIGSFLTLLIVGYFLCATVKWSRGISYAIGVHAGWVAVIRAYKSMTFDVPKSKFTWVVGNYDGITGYLAAVWISLLFALVYFIVRQKKGKEDAPSSAGDDLS